MDRFVPVAVDENEILASGDGVIGAFNGIYSFDIANPEVERFREGFLQDNFCVEVGFMEALEGNGLGSIVEVVVAFQEFRVLFISHGSGRLVRDNSDVSSRAVGWKHCKYVSGEVS